MHGASCWAHVFAPKQHVRRTFVRTFTTHPNPGTTPPHSRLNNPELLQQRLLSSSLHLQHLLPSPHKETEYLGSPAQPESTSYDPSELESSHGHRIRVRVSGPVYHPSRKTVVIESGSESAAQSILHRNPDVEFGLPAHWQPAGESVIPVYDSPIHGSPGGASLSLEQHMVCITLRIRYRPVKLRSPARTVTWMHRWLLLLPQP